jgi:hypothetical protein
MPTLTNNAHLQAQAPYDDDLLPTAKAKLLSSFTGNKRVMSADLTARKRLALEQQHDIWIVCTAVPSTS